MNRYLLLLLAVGCGQVEPECPEVECAWVDNVCHDVHQEISEQFESRDNGASACWHYESTCTKQAAPTECVPKACQATHYTCQPWNVSELGQP